MVPALGKERQFKIIKGSMVYYLRTISRDYRQPWLDAINESIRVYHYSVQRAAGVGDFGTALPSHSSMSSVSSIITRSCTVHRIIVYLHHMHAVDSAFS